MAESQEIELELPEEEVDIHEADVIQESAQDVNFSAEGETSNEDELNEYSDGVKKRIDKLTYRMREAERQREEAVELAKQMADQNAQLQTKLQSSDSTLVNEYATRVESQKEQARKALKEAQELGDAEAIALATEAVAKTSLAEQNAQRLKQRQQSPAAKHPQQPVQQHLGRHRWATRGQPRQPVRPAPGFGHPPAHQFEDHRQQHRSQPCVSRVPEGRVVRGLARSPLEQPGQAGNPHRSPGHRCAVTPGLLRDRSLSRQRTGLLEPGASTPGRRFQPQRSTRQR